MRNLIRTLATALAVPLAVATVASPPPAGAESVTIHDPAGDADGYDITKMRLRHGPKRVGFELHQENTPYWYEIRVDTPGPKRYKHVAVWSVYTPRKAWVYTRHAYEQGGEPLCTFKKAKVADDNSVVSFSFSRSCFGPPKSVRAKAIAWDDQFGWMDRTGWTEWAHVA